MKKLLITTITALILTTVSGCSSSAGKLKLCFLEMENATTSIIKGNGTAGECSSDASSW